MFSTVGYVAKWSGPVLFFILDCLGRDNSHLEDENHPLYIQADSPGKDKESNWLPAPKEPFYMLMRMYLPKIEVLNGQYEIPGVVKGK
jgi:hypothetical protein